MSELSDTIDGFTEAQKQKFNQTCTSKIYSDADGSLTTEEEDQATNAANEVDNLNDAELNDLIGELTLNLSGRPC